MTDPELPTPPPTETISEMPSEAVFAPLGELATMTGAVRTDTVADATKSDWVEPGASPGQLYTPATPEYVEKLRSLGLPGPGETITVKQIPVIYDRYEQLVRKMVRARMPESMGACSQEDVVQETFLALHHNFVDQGRSLKPNQMIGTWLAGVVSNKIADFFRREGRHARYASVRLDAEYSKDEVEASTASEVDTLDEVLDQERAAQVRQVLETLDPRSREVLELRLMQGLSAAEVGEIVGVTENYTRLLQYRALKQLRQLPPDPDDQRVEQSRLPPDIARAIPRPKKHPEEPDLTREELKEFVDYQRQTAERRIDAI